HAAEDPCLRSRSPVVASWGPSLHRPISRCLTTPAGTVPDLVLARLVDGCPVQWFCAANPPKSIGCCRLPSPPFSRSWREGRGEGQLLHMRLSPLEPGLSREGLDAD